jgi:drug/metabolite transporter (DMT)-like permease
MLDSKTRFSLPFILIIAILAISTASIFIRFAQAEGAPSITIAAIRLTIASLILAPIAWTRHQAEIKSLTRSDRRLALFAGIFLAIHFATWITSLEYTSVASSAVFVSTGPLWVAMLSPLLLNERLTRAAVIGVVVALVGGAIIGLSDACGIENGLRCPELSQIMHGRSMWGNFLALCGAWAVSGYLLIGRKVRAKMSLIPYIFLVYSISAIVLILFMIGAGQSPAGYSPATYFWIFLLAAIPQLIGHSTFNWLLKYLPATLVAVASLSEPVGSAILAFFILSEAPTPGLIIGGVLILIGIFLTSRNQ